ncbi:MAG: O-antigen ligase family protein [Oscillospiraceae bacterium]|nr:O-antigen ligase family protein [Oscillospiraceae bacterium]
MEHRTGPLCALRETPVIQRINRFLRTPQYILVVMGLVALSNCFSLELPVYTVAMLTCCYVCLFGDDLLALMPIVCSFYMSVSARNSPGLHKDSVFFSWGWYMIAIVALFIGCLIFRLCTDDRIGKKAFLTKKRKMLPGLLILGIAYVMGGLLSPAYPDTWKKSVIFALLQFAALAVPYFLFTGAVDWKKAPKEYFPWIGFGIGGMLLALLLKTYIAHDVIRNGAIVRDMIFAGWGMYNNIGCMLAMGIPFAFYLASRYQKGWIGSVVGSLFLVGVFFTCSRGSILVGTAAYLLCIMLMTHSAKNKKSNTVVIFVFVSAITLALLLFYQPLIEMFRDVLERGLDPNNRNFIYEAGWKQFLQSPVFGGSFYPLDYAPYDFAKLENFSSFIPPRWHNTVIQLLACTGIVGLGAYIYHRYETVRLFLEDRTREKAFIACSFAVLLGCSLVDCHFFNIGPGLFYSAGLAFAECCESRK